jgi:hypothetical protein
MRSGQRSAGGAAALRRRADVLKQLLRRSPRGAGQDLEIPFAKDNWVREGVASQVQDLSDEGTDHARLQRGKRVHGLEVDQVFGRASRSQDPAKDPVRRGPVQLHELAEPNERDRALAALVPRHGRRSETATGGTANLTQSQAALLAEPAQRTTRLETQIAVQPPFRVRRWFAGGVHSMPVTTAWRILRTRYVIYARPRTIDVRQIDKDTLRVRHSRFAPTRQPAVLLRRSNEKPGFSLVLWEVL